MSIREQRSVAPKSFAFTTRTRVFRASMIAATAVLAWVAAPARAQHEAIFGPQSSLVLSAPAFVSMQTYTRRLNDGNGGVSTQASTVLLGMAALEVPNRWRAGAGLLFLIP